MAVLSLPTTPKFASLSFRLETNTQTFESPLNNSAQTLELPGARWVLEGNLPPLTRAQAAAWRAFLVKARGQTGRIYIGDQANETPLGLATGTPLVKGASQTGRTLLTDGWTAGITGILKAGDYCAYDPATANRQMHMLIANANSDGSGNATLSFEPPIRVSPADNAPLIVQAPTCVMRLTDDTHGWTATEGIIGIHGFTISAVESFYDTV